MLETNLSRANQARISNHSMLFQQFGASTHPNHDPNPNPNLTPSPQELSETKVMVKKKFEAIHDILVRMEVRFPKQTLFVNPNPDSSTFLGCLLESFK